MWRNLWITPWSKNGSRIGKINLNTWFQLLSGFSQIFFTLFWYHKTFSHSDTGHTVYNHTCIGGRVSFNRIIRGLVNFSASVCARHLDQKALNAVGKIYFVKKLPDYFLLHDSFNVKYEKFIWKFQTEKLKRFVEKFF